MEECRFFSAQRVMEGGRSRSGAAVAINNAAGQTLKMGGGGGQTDALMQGLFAGGTQETDRRLVRTPAQNISDFVEQQQWPPDMLVLFKCLS